VPFVRTSTIVTVGVASQLSVAVTVAALGIAEHSTVVFAGTPTKTGAVLSSTVITWLAVDVLLQLSTAVQVLVKMYPSEHEPFVRTSTIVTVGVASQLSVAVTMAALGIAEHSTVVFAGTPTKTGAVLSSTVITWLAVLVLLQLSTAVHVRVSTYPSGHEPFVRTSTIVTVGVASQLSVAVTIAALGMAEHSTVVFAGTPTNTGAVLSSTVIT
jgi:glucan phosphoethanolaminetransferase (alkaline phosphatase superfamily)